MKADIKTKIYKLFTALLTICTLGTIFIPSVAQASTKDNKISEYYYVYDDDSLLTRGNIDEISNYGASLNAGGVKLIVNVKKQSPSDLKKETQNIFYNYVKENNGDKKVVVYSYYTESKEFYLYDDYGIFDEKDLTQIKKDLEKYQTLGRVKDGIIYSYKDISKIVNNHFSLNLDSISNLQLEDISSNSAIVIRNILGVAIVVVFLIGMRRNKSVSLD